MTEHSTPSAASQVRFDGDYKPSADADAETSGLSTSGADCEEAIKELKPPPHLIKKPPN